MSTHIQTIEEFISDCPQFEILVENKDGKIFEVERLKDNKVFNQFEGYGNAVEVINSGTAIQHVVFITEFCADFIHVVLRLTSCDLDVSPKHIHNCTGVCEINNIEDFINLMIEQGKEMFRDKYPELY